MGSKSIRYNNTLLYLNSLVDFSFIPNLDHAHTNFDLKRIIDLLELMGNPQSAFPIIHIAGTKGKGSTAAIMESVLQKAGYKVGLFTSPYLFDFCEQIQINGKPISEVELTNKVAGIKPLLEVVKGITTFEAVTAIGFQFFKEQKVDFAVIEAGLGGRTDATNVVEPLISIITSISFDHTGMLGNTIKEIADHKAGIIKRGRPVVIAPQGYSEAQNQIENTALRLGSEFIFVDETVDYSEITHSLEGQIIKMQFKENPTDWNGDYNLPLLGKHQLDNVATALTTLREINKYGYHITIDQVKAGLKKVKWPCRFEVVSKKPLIILDGAHNVDSVIKLKQTITDYLAGRKIILIFGVSADKDISGMLDILLPGVQNVIFTKSEHPRAADPAKLVELVNLKTVPYASVETISDALVLAENLADNKSVIVVTGSLFIAAQARTIILNS